MSFKSRKCNCLPGVSPELAQIDELQNSSALTPKWSERGSFDTGVRISSNSLYWLSVRQGDISQSRYTTQKNWNCTHFCSCICFQLLFTFKYMWNFHTRWWTVCECIGLCRPGEANLFLICMFCFRFQFNWIQQHWSTHSDWKLTQWQKWNTYTRSEKCFL